MEGSYKIVQINPEKKHERLESFDFNCQSGQSLAV